MVAWTVLMTMAIVLLVVFVVRRFDPRVAYRLLSHCQRHMFEPEPSEAISMGARTPKRKQFSPLISKQVAARQQFRCAICNRLFDDQLWDLDHIVPLFRGGTNDLSNIRALGRACHMQVSAAQRAHSSALRTLYLAEEVASRNRHLHRNAHVRTSWAVEKSRCRRVCAVQDPTERWQALGR